MRPFVVAAVAITLSVFAASCSDGSSGTSAPDDSTTTTTIRSVENVQAACLDEAAVDDNFGANGGITLTGEATPEDIEEHVATDENPQLEASCAYESPHDDLITTRVVITVASHNSDTIPAGWNTLFEDAYMCGIGCNGESHLEPNGFLDRFNPLSETAYQWRNATVGTSSSPYTMTHGTRIKVNDPDDHTRNLVCTVTVTQTTQFDLTADNLTHALYTGTEWAAHGVCNRTLTLSQT